MILVTGSLAFDYIMDFPGKFSDHIMPDKIHTLNLSFLVNTLKKQKGGTAGNIAYNLAILKCPVSILGAAGADFSVPTESGYSYGQFLKDAGVDISKIKIIDNDSTSSAYIMTDKVDNQISGFYPGAMSENSSLSLKELGSDFVVVSPNDPKAMVKFAQECKELGVDHMIDPGMQLPALSSEDLKEMVKGATILIGNDYEIALLKERTALSEEQILDQVKILITTLGADGSVIQTAENMPPSRSQSPPGRWQIKAAKSGQKKIATVRSVDMNVPRNDNGVVDPTGAGDAYRAGFLAGYLKKLDLQVCGQMGSVTACYAIEKYGTTSHTFTVEEFRERYKENFGEEPSLLSLRV